MADSNDWRFGFSWRLRREPRPSADVVIGRDSSARDRVAAILRAAGASAEFLLAADDWRTAVPRVLAALGEATQASRVYVFENGRAADGTLTTSQRFEWTAPGITAQGDQLLGLSYKDIGFSRWIGLLEDGGTISGPVSELPALERPFLEAQQVRSILIVPVRAGARWWGLIGFDDCISERDHSPAENDLLRAAGSSLGAAIARSEMHRELRTSEARYRLLAENFPHGAVVMFDHDLRYTLAEGRGLGAVGLDGTTMVGRTLDEVFPGETGRLIEGDCRRALAGELVTNVVSYAGRVFRTVTAPVRGDSGEVTAGMAVMQDITDAEGQAARLRRSEAMYGELVEHAAYGIYRSTPAGAFLSVNPALVRMLGYESAAELLAVDLRSLYERTGERERLLELPGADVSVDVPEVVWLHKSGRSLIVRLTGRAVHDHDGRLECFEMFVEDVTERRALEAQLRQSQKMEAIGQLVGGIAHDFNNLLTTVMGNAELVLESVGPPGTDAGDAAADIRDAAASGAALVRKMMTVSRKEALSIRSADLAVLTTDVLRMARRILPSNIAVSADIPNVPQVARFDRGAVEQVLLNLLTNARDAMPSGGTPQSRHRGDRALTGASRRARTRSAGPTRLPQCHRHGSGHGRRDRRPHLRALLHHQARWERHGAWSGDGVRTDAAASRGDRSDERTRQGHDRATLLRRGRLRGAGCCREARAPRARRGDDPAGGRQCRGAHRRREAPAAQRIPDPAGLGR